LIGCLNGDIDILAEVVEEAKKVLKRKVLEVATKK